MKLGANDVSAVKIGSTDVNKVYLGANLVWQKVAATLLLDLYPNAAAAYSLRKIRAAYSGSAIRVRRSSDNTEQDIGFVANELDTASLLSFVGGGDGFVRIWYDQSGGEGNNVTQDNASAQPKIVSSGIVIERNSTPAVQFDGTNDNISNFTSAFINTTDVSYFSVSNNDVSESAGAIHSQYSINNYSIRVFNDRRTTIKRNLIVTSSTIITYTSDLASYSNTANQRLLSAFIDSSKNMSSYKDGVVGTTDTYVGTTENNGLVLGSQVAVRFLNGTIQEVIAYNSDQSENRAGIESNINSNYNIYWDGSQTGLLDDYPNAAAAYSLRALNSAYTGAAIKVRRSSDNEEQDIKLLYDGNLDTASLLSFVGSGDGFVSTWYDQSGGNDVTQVEASKQPQIVSSGVVVTTSGNYAVDFTSSAKYLVNATFNNSTAISSVFTLIKSASSSGTQIITDSTDSSTRQVSGYYGAAPSVFNIFKGIVTRSQTPHNTNLNLLSTFFDVNSDLYLNGVKIIDTLNAGTNNRQGFTLGSGIDGVVPFKGSIFEVIIFDEQNKSSDRVGIETNINDYYTIY